MTPDTPEIAELREKFEQFYRERISWYVSFEMRGKRYIDDEIEDCWKCFQAGAKTNER